MENDLKLLIDHCEAEQRLLQSLLDECLLEEDYEYAKFYSKNLRLLQKTLYNLKCLSDYSYSEKSEVLRVLSNIKFAIKKDNNENKWIKEWQEKRLNEFNERLLKLNQLPIVEVVERYDIENAIIRLLEKEINGFKIFTEKKFNLYLDFTLLKPDVIHIRFTPFKDLVEYSFDNFFHDSEIEALRKNGFTLSADANIFYLDFDLTNKSTRSLIILLSQIFFEILHWHSRKDFELEIY